MRASRPLPRTLGAGSHRQPSIHVMSSVFVFNGARAAFPSAVFRDRESAINWISQYGLSGTLTEYPLGEGVYHWAIKAGHFRPKRTDQEAPSFIERFTSASQWHEHFVNGAVASASSE
jgi:hypothetical protein